MSGMKRTLRTRITRLSSRKSSYDAKVTLSELESDDSKQSPSKRIKREDAKKPVPDSLSSSSRKRSEKSPRKAKTIPQALAIPHPAPPRWQETYDAIKQMRKNITAPVDTMGCDQAQFKETNPKNCRFATLISLMLSSQTKDEVTDAAVSRLRIALGGSLNVDAVIAADDTVISDAINKVGFWRRKTEYIKKAAQRLLDDFDSDIPKTVDELCSLPGVGPKMAFLALQVAWNINVGIGVDVHVHRITNRLGWHKPPTKTPEETRLNLQSWLPTELHPDINHMLVGFGQVICTPVGPKCNSCDLSITGLCPSATKTRTSSKARKTADAEVPNADPLPKVEITIDVEEKPVLFTTNQSSRSSVKAEQEIKEDLVW